MENEKLQINLGAGVTKAEVILRETSKVNELEVKAPVKIGIVGTIGAPFEWLSKRKDHLDQIPAEHCHILVNRENISIELVMNEHDEYLKGYVKGELQFHPKFQEFGINDDKVWTPTELGMFFKMNRAFFESTKDNMDLVSKLMNFTATVNNNIERSASENGSKTDNFSQIVNSNLPASFKLVIPIFKGMTPEIIEVETFARISGRDVCFVLLSPGANQITESIRDNAIDDQLTAIRGLCPNIAIIEQ